MGRSTQRGRGRRSVVGTIAVAGVAVLAAATFTTGATAGAGATAPPASAAAAGANWPAYLFSAGHSSYNGATTAITPTDAPSLQQVWRWLPPGAGTLGDTYLLASPTVYDGVIYIGVDDGYFYAISQTTRRVLWSAFLGKDTAKPDGQCGDGSLGIISTATVAPDPVTGELRVFVFGPDGNLYAFDATTGAVVWKGLVDTPSTTVNDYFSWGSPLVADGNVYVGISSDCDLPLVPGGLVAFNQSTGAQVAKWASVPAGQIGGSIWSSPAVAPDGSIVVTTGNATLPAVEPLYNESIIRLNPTTLQEEDAWQVPAADQTGDGDFGGSPTFFTATLGGTPTTMVGACNKNGVYYALREDDLAAGPVWQQRITIPYQTNGKYSAEECDAAAVWNGTDLIEGGGAPTTASEPEFTGSIQALDPATGALIWQTHLDGTIVGSPTEAGGGVVAAPTYQSATGQLGVYLINAATGAQVGFIPTPDASNFGQDVFVGNDLLVGSRPGLGLTEYAVFPTLTSASPVTLATGVRHAVSLGGTNVEPGATLTVAGPSTGVSVVGGSVSASTTGVGATMVVAATATPGSYSVTVHNPDGATATCTACLTVVAAPTLAGIVPATAAPGKVVPVTVTGTGFVAGAALAGPPGVFFTGITVVGPTTITASLHVVAAAAPGTGLAVVVTNAAAGGYGRVTAPLLSIS